MKQILFFFTLPCLLLAYPSFAKGHGGGHGGGHSGGGHAHAATHAAPHSGSQQGNTRSSGSSFSGHRATAHTSSKAIITRSTSPSVIAANHGHRFATGLATAVPRTGSVANNTTASSYTTPASFENYNNGYYGSSYSYYPYYASPVFYDPYYSPFMFGFGFMYSPNYYPANSPRYAGSSNDDQISKEPMDGFVVFYDDTISGAVTVARRAVSMETTDSGKDYDYHFREKDPGLQYVAVYNEDDKQLNLVRLKGDTKKLWRVIHTGKLNIYDGRRGFIYKPEDIDLKTLTISYNAEITSINSSSAQETKQWLTGYVNQVYNLNLDPKKFTWNELLIYIDKLD